MLFFGGGGIKEQDSFSELKTTITKFLLSYFQNVFDLSGLNRRFEYKCIPVCVRRLHPEHLQNLSKLVDHKL